MSIGVGWCWQLCVSTVSTGGHRRARRPSKDQMADGGGSGWIDVRVCKVVQ